MDLYQASSLKGSINTMFSSPFKSHTNAHIVYGRPTLNVLKRYAWKDHADVRLVSIVTDHLSSLRWQRHCEVRKTSSLNLYKSLYLFIFNKSLQNVFSTLADVSASLKTIISSCYRDNNLPKNWTV